jgi:tRNA nucleotidyltransferase (CCA-adding enzyme)
MGDDWLAETFATACERCVSGIPHPHLYLALLFYRLTVQDIEKVIAYLHFPKAAAQVLRDTAAIKSSIIELSAPGSAPSLIYELLHGYSLLAIEANTLGAGSETAAEHIELYLNVLRHVNPTLTGEDLLKLGIPQGPKIKEFLKRLREARLDGKINSKKDEEEMVKKWEGN